MAFVKTPQTTGNPLYPPLPLPCLDFANGQYLTVTGTHAVSAAFTAPVVYVAPDTDVYVNIALAPVATVGAGSYPVAANTERPFPVPNGFKISVIRKTTSGTCVLMPVCVA